MAPNISEQVNVVSPPSAAASRISLDPTLGRRGAVDGGWWPGSRDASVELPNLVSALTAQVGTVLRLGIDARDWDEIPRRMTVGGHVVRVGRFADLNHKIIVTCGSQDHLMLLVVPPRASTAAAKSALALAASGAAGGRPEEILVASGIEDEIGPDAPRANPDHGDDPNRRPRSAGAETVRPARTGDGLRDGWGEIGRWSDDGAPSPDLPPKHAN